MRIFPTTIIAMLSLLLASTSWSDDFAIGQQAYDSGDYETALTKWQPLAEDGLADAQFGVGLLYANGFGVSMDDDLALKWYGLAADQGHGQAQCNLAVMHANGWGVPQSDEEAFKWYSLAAEQGVTPAQISLGRTYSNSFGDELDNVQAYKWFTIAAGLGDDDASYERENIASRMSPEEISEADLLANAWMESHQNLQANHLEHPQ
ncbi:MAG: sel1 repeat family protein [Gammaproteobacteria bacterium]|nr:sel1 repeat family protein [Gammaproteobacteria bacterium]